MDNFTESGRALQAKERKPGTWESSSSASKIIDSGPLNCMKIVLFAVIPYRSEKKLLAIECHVIVGSVE